MARPSAQRPWLRAVSPEEARKEEPRQEGPSDEELIEAVVNGDPRVAGQIHDRLIRVVDHTLFRVLGKREFDHDDLLQSSFEQILLSLGRGNFAGNCSLKTWAARITTHVALNAMRSRQRERRVIHRSEQPEEIPARSASPSAEAHLEIDRVRSALTRLKPLSAEVLILHEVHGYTLSEIATLTNLSVSAAQSRLVRARSELHRLMTREPRFSKGRDS